MTEVRRVTKSRLSRRSMLRATALGVSGISAAALIGCGGDDEGDAQQTATPRSDATGASTSGSPTRAATTDAGAPRSGGRLQYLLPSNFDGLNPHVTPNTVTTGLAANTYNYLIRNTALFSDTQVFDLAESVEIPEATRYVFKIREGAKIAPNSLGIPERDLDATDVVANWEWHATEEAAQIGGFIRQRGITYEAPDPRTFVLTTTAGPYAWTLELVGSLLSVAVLPKELLEGDFDIAREGVGAGAFMMTEFRDGEGVTLERNPNYFGPDLPYLDGIDYRVITDRATQRTAFASQQVHNYSAKDSREAESLMSGTEGLRHDAMPDPSYLMLVMQSQLPPFDDARVRRAVSRALNRQQMIDVILGGDGTPAGIVAPSLTAYALPQDELASDYQPYDPADTKKLLDAAGFTDGLSIRLMYPINYRIDVAGTVVPPLLNQLSEVGIEVEQEAVDGNDWLARFRGLDYQATLSPGTYSTPERPLDWHVSTGPYHNDTFNRGLGVAEIDDAIARVQTSTDLEERVDFALEAQRLIYSHDPSVLPFYTGNLNLLSWEFVKNYRVPESTYFSRLVDLWLDEQA